MTMASAAEKKGTQPTANGSIMSPPATEIQQKVASTPGGYLNQPTPSPQQPPQKLQETPRSTSAIPSLQVLAAKVSFPATTTMATPSPQQQPFIALPSGPTPVDVAVGAKDVDVVMKTNEESLQKATSPSYSATNGSETSTTDDEAVVVTASDDTERSKAKDDESLSTSSDSPSNSSPSDEEPKVANDSEQCSDSASSASDDVNEGSNDDDEHSPGDIEDMEIDNIPASGAQGSSPRRSKRERTSTTIQIGGHTVLRKNNYKVTGMDYVWGDEPPEQSPSRTVNKPPQTKKQKVQHHDAKPRQKSQHEVARGEHNSKVIQATQPKNVLRQRFLYKHIDLLRHFCEEKVLDELKADVEAHGKHNMDVVVNVSDVKQPKAIQNATLRDYQVRGLQFMVKMHRQNLAMILGDEMGLGKTIQTISLISYLKEEENVTGPSLVIAPLSVLSSWCNEMSKWAPSIKFFRLHASDPNEQKAQKEELQKRAHLYDVIVTTYEMAKLPALKSLYSRLHFNYLVLDEGHKIKAHDTLISQAVRKIHFGNTIILTGTPLQNNLVELWSLLNFLYPSIFTTLKPFEKAFNLNDNIIDKKFLAKSQQLLDLVMLRRLKSHVETKLPPKLETKVYCPLSKTQAFWYKSLLLKDLSHLANCEDKNENDDGDDSGNNTWSKHNILRNLFMQLRKCCNHPFVFKGAEGDPDETTLEDLVSASGKMSVLDMLLQSLCKKGHRCVLFSQFTQMLDILEDYCKLRGWQYCRLDGNTPRAKRNYLINRFNEQPISPFFIFLVSTRSGGMGLNLQSADTCILYDSDWNPQMDIQAMGRVHRIGQTKKVHIYRLVSCGTVEERMIQRAEKKLLLETVNRETKTDSNLDEDHDIRGLSSKELFEDIKFGSEAVFGATSMNELPTWEDVQLITDRSRKESDSVGKLQGGKQLNANTFDETKEFSSTEVFGGKDFRAIREEQIKLRKSESSIPKQLDGIGALWHQITAGQKREKKNRIVFLKGNGSGYGSASVPVLSSNNYDLENGESSVFDRELRGNNKESYAVAKKKRKNATPRDNVEYCQICWDGGTIVCCPRCPCSVHLECVALKHVREFKQCLHHQCSGGCGKTRQGAGGLLYPCHACWRSFCEDCLPKKGITFLDKVEHFEKLGYNTSKGDVIYINCSKECEAMVKDYYGYKQLQKNHPQKCPEALDVSFNFGAAYNLEYETAKIEKSKQEELARPRRAKVEARENFKGSANKTKAKSAQAIKSSTKLAASDSFKEKAVATVTTPNRKGVRGRINTKGDGDTPSPEKYRTSPKPAAKKSQVSNNTKSSFDDFTFESVRATPKSPAKHVQPLKNTQNKSGTTSCGEGRMKSKRTVKSIKMALTLPPGPLGVKIKQSDAGQCFVNCPSSSHSVLKYRDIITAVNGSTLPVSLDTKDVIPIFKENTGKSKTLSIIREVPISSGTDEKVVQLCPHTRDALAIFDTVDDAAKIVGYSGSALNYHLLKMKPESAFFGNSRFQYLEDVQPATAPSLERNVAAFRHATAPEKIEKLCPETGRLLGSFKSVGDAVRSIGETCATKLRDSLKRKTHPVEYNGYLWRSNFGRKKVPRTPEAKPAGKGPKTNLGTEASSSDGVKAEPLPEDKSDRDPIEGTKVEIGSQSSPISILDSDEEGKECSHQAKTRSRRKGLGRTPPLCLMLIMIICFVSSARGVLATSNDKPDDECPDTTSPQSCPASILPDSATTSNENRKYRQYGAASQSSEESRISEGCELVWAPKPKQGDNDASAIEWGVFSMVDRERGTRVLPGDVVLQLVDPPGSSELSNGTPQTEVESTLRKWIESFWLWQGQETGGQYDGQESVNSFVPGLGMLANTAASSNGGSFKNNILPFVPRVDEGGLTRQESPGAGAISHYHNYTWYVQRPIKAGEELTMSNHFFYGHSFVMPSDGEKDDEIGASDESNNAPSSLSTEYLLNNGFCLDNIKATSRIGSKLKHAGRGALATRSLPKGSIVSPVPVLPVPESLLQIQPTLPQKSKKSALININDKQILLNYCYRLPNVTETTQAGESSSSGPNTIWLFPYAPLVNLVNHYPTPNVQLQWSKETLASLDVQDYADEHNLNVRIMKFVEQQLLNSKSNGKQHSLIMELVALQDIKEGEELFLDYGPAWEEAWYQHIKSSSWKQNQDQYEHYAPAWVLDDTIRLLRTEKEQIEHPYPSNVQTSCFYRYQDNADKVDKSSTEASQEAVTTFRWNMTKGIFDMKHLRPCSVVRRSDNDEKGRKTLYAVRMYNRPGLEPEEVIPSPPNSKIPELHIVTHVPRSAIRLTDKPYTTDVHLPNAFRHDIGLPRSLTTTMLSPTESATSLEDGAVAQE